MKNFILLLGMMLFAGMAMGQMKVFSSGNTVVGDNSGLTDAAAELQVVGLSQSEGNTVEFTGNSASTVFNRTDGAAFIAGAGLSAGGFTFDENFNMDIRRRNRAGIVNNRFLAGGSVVMRLRGSDGNVGVGTIAATERLTVNGNVLADNVSIASDKRLKNNVSSYNNGLKAVMSLKPITYNYNGKALKNATTKHVGLFAQELQEVAPELVSTFEHLEEDENGKIIVQEEYLKINDTGIKYLLIIAIQEQQALIEELQAQVSDLQSSIGAVDSDAVDNVDLVDVVQSTLDQNSPNPYNEATVISYTVADNATSAKMNFYNLTGQLIKSVSLQSGAGKLSVSADELPSGTYTYSLEVDGALISNKKMVKMR